MGLSERNGVSFDKGINQCPEYALENVEDAEQKSRFVERARTV